MADVLDRVGPGSADADRDDTEDLLSLEVTESAPADRTASLPVAKPGRVMLATGAGSTAMVAFSLVAAHVNAPLQAVALVVIAWLELAAAVLVLSRPTKRLLQGTIALNLVVVALFALNHTVAMPGTPRGAGVTFAGAVTAALAALIIATALIVLWRPQVGAGWDSSSLVLATMAPVAVLALATAAIALPGSSADTSTTGVETTAAPADVTTTVAVATPTTASGPALAEGESVENTPDVALNAADQKLLGEQLVQARQAAAKYPTVADAKRAGMILAGGTSPGTGAHYQLMSAATLAGINPDGTVNASSPGSYIYDGTTDDAPIVGVMYISFNDTAPEGFAGPNDHWHRHSNVCVKFADGKISVPVAADQDVTKQQCDALNGTFMPKTVWMVHAWVVPGWESPKGVFSHDNPNVHCPDGSDQVDSLGVCLAQ
jgi:hypothetical protein